MASRSQYTDDFRVLGLLGEGRFGKVFVIEHRKTHDLFARKEIDLQWLSDGDKEKTLNEVELMKRAKHPHIVSYISSDLTDECLCIYTEYCAGGDLHHLISSISDPSIPEELIICWLCQMAQALECLHGKRILHRDLKPQNIYLTKDGNIKIGDLGISRQLKNSESVATTFAGSPCYMSPEIFSGHGYDDKTDIWSLGCVVYELATTDRAYSAQVFQYLVHQVVSGRTPMISRSYSKDLVDLNYKLMSKDPERRPSARDILTMEPVKSVLSKPKKPLDILSTLTTSSINEGVLQSQAKLKKVPDGDYRGHLRLPVDSLTLSRLSASEKSTLYSTASSSSSSQTVFGIDTIIAKSASSTKGSKRDKVQKKMPSFQNSTADNETLSEVLSSITTLSTHEGRLGSSLGLDTDERRDLIVLNIQKLQQICAVGIGVKSLQIAYRIVEYATNSRDMEEKLKELLQDRYTIYLPYIMYLRIFEAILDSH